MSESTVSVGEDERSWGGTVIEVMIESEEFALAHTFDAVSELTCEVERIAAGECECPLSLLRVHASSLSEVESAFATDPTVERSHLLAEFGDERLYQMEWEPETEAAVGLLLEENGVILSARATGDRWQFQLLFPHNEALSQIPTEIWTDELDVTIQEIYNCERNSQLSPPLTDAQKEAVEEALEHGYYEVPREIELEELAARFDISHQALSSRLRRGHKSLVADYLSRGDGRPTRSQRDISSEAAENT